MFCSFHNKELPAVFSHMQALDESRIHSMQDSLNDFVTAQKEFGQEYVVRFTRFYNLRWGDEGVWGLAIRLEDSLV